MSHHVCSRDQTPSCLYGSGADSRRGGGGHLRGDRDPYRASRDRTQPPTHSSHGKPDSMHGRTVSGMHGQGGRQKDSRRGYHEDREHVNGHRVPQRGREESNPDRYDGRQEERPARHHDRCRLQTTLRNSHLMHSACWQYGAPWMNADDGGHVVLSALSMAGRAASSGIMGAGRRKSQMRHPRSATALRRRTERLIRGASGSARPASQPALLWLQTRLQGSNPRRQQRLVKTHALSIPLPQAYPLCKHRNCHALQVLPRLSKTATLERFQKQTLGFTTQWQRLSIPLHALRWVLVCVREATLVAVRSMMGAGGPQAPMTLEQKKRLLWGKKPDPEEPPLQEAYGANRWDTAEFSKAEDRSKFIKLMVMSHAAFIPADHSYVGSKAYEICTFVISGCQMQTLEARIPLKAPCTIYADNHMPHGTLTLTSYPCCVCREPKWKQRA